MEEPTTQETPVVRRFGRPRRSTVIMIVVFVAALVLYGFVAPEEGDVRVDRTELKQLRQNSDKLTRSPSPTPSPSPSRRPTSGATDRSTEQPTASPSNTASVAPTPSTTPTTTPTTRPSPSATITPRPSTTPTAEPTGPSESASATPDPEGR